MPYDLESRLVIGIASSALFDLKESDEVFRTEGESAYRDYQQENIDLIPDPVRAPVVESIFRLRVVERLGYDAIAKRLNADRDRYPVPEPTSPRRRRGTWSGSAVRDILTNPKYTGYMVWNRRATKSGGKVNPPEDWV